MNGVIATCEKAILFGDIAVDEIVDREALKNVVSNLKRHKADCLIVAGELAKRLSKESYMSKALAAARFLSAVAQHLGASNIIIVPAMSNMAKSARSADHPLEFYNTVVGYLKDEGFDVVLVDDFMAKVKVRSKYYLIVGARNLTGATRSGFKVANSVVVNLVFTRPDLFKYNPPDVIIVPDYVADKGKRILGAVGEPVEVVGLPPLIPATPRAIVHGIGFAILNTSYDVRRFPVKPGNMGKGI